MKLVRFRQGDRVQLGVMRDGGVVSLEDIRESYPTMLSLIEGGDDALAAVVNAIGDQVETLPLDSVELLAPVERPGKFLAIGMNYAKHAEEAERVGVPRPKQQLWFNKQTTCLSGPFDPIDRGVSEQVDYEVELAVVIGRSAKCVTEAEAHRHVFGYMVANDVSARDWQHHSPTFTMGKSFDTHGPVGPCLVTTDEIVDPHALRLRCWVNDELRQDSTTASLVHDIWKQISYLSTAFTLEPGDIIATGTPEGVGAAMTPPKFLQSGDVVRCEVDGIGVIENRVL